MTRASSFFFVHGPETKLDAGDSRQELFSFPTRGVGPDAHHYFSFGTVRRVLRLQ